MGIQRFLDVKMTAGNNSIIIIMMTVANIYRGLVVCTLAHFIFTVTYEAGAAITHLQVRKQMKRDEVSCLRPLSS